MNSKSRTFFRRTAAAGNLILVLAIVMLVMTTASADVGTAFTYQGQLLDGGSAVDDICDIQFSLYDASTDGNPVGSTVTKSAVDIIDGLFKVELDFGPSAFGGDPRWLELAVRCPAGSGGYDTLSPRQSLAPTPYAMYATWATTATIASSVETGVITPANLNGIVETGDSGQLLTSDGSGGFAWQAPATVSVKQLVQDFVMASGESVSAGDVVSFLNGEAYGSGEGWGDELVFSAASTYFVAVSDLSATDFVIAYRDNGNSYYGTAIVGTITGGSVTWGEESVFNAASTSYVSVSGLSTTDFVVAYSDEGNSGYGTAIVGTVSGGSVAWGEESVFNTAYTHYVAVSGLSATGFVVAYCDQGNSNYGTAIAGTAIWGSVTWGDESVFNAAPTYPVVAVSGLSATDFVVAYRDRGNSSYGTAIVGTVSGGSVTWGSESVFHASSISGAAVSALSTADFVVAYCDENNSSYGMAVVGTVSGDSVTWGSESVFNAASTSYVAVSGLSTTGFVLVYRDDDNSSYGTAIVGTVSGGSVTWGHESVFNTASTSSVAVSGLSATDFVVAYSDGGNLGYGTAIAGSDLRRLIGTARDAASGGETVTVIIDGVSDVHTDLVPGVTYYMQADGSLAPTATARRVGVAISETELILDQLW